MEEEMNEGIEVFEETEEIEFGLDNAEIEEWISRLIRLREEKSQIILNIDEVTDLKINYEEGEEENE